MKNFKKMMIACASVLTLSCVLPIINASADYDGTINIGVSHEEANKNDVLNTMVEKNVLMIQSADCKEDTTTLYFVDGTTYTISDCVDDLIYSQTIHLTDEELANIDEQYRQYYETEFYYIIGYAIDCQGYHVYNQESTNNWQDIEPTPIEDIILPDGTHAPTDYMYDHIQAVYNLDGEYVGYRTSSGESDFGDIVYPTTIGDSDSPIQKEIPLGDTPTGIRGDIDYDGDVDAVDLLLLKKYLLQMITW